VAEQRQQKAVQAPKVRQGPSPTSTGGNRSRRGVYGVVAAAIVAVAVLAIGVTVFGPSNDPEFAPGVDTIATGIPQNGLVLGEPDAPVTIAEYADVQCPFCAQLAAELPEVVDRYVKSGRVKLELRGLAFIGEDSLEGMKYVYAAAEDDKAWDVADLLYRSQGGENTGWVDDELLADVAEAVGLDPDELADRAASAEVASAISKENARATELGISSTPTLLIGKTGGELRRIELEALEAEALFPIIDEELGAAS
jgi:protein-disulfide isomerase